ncbi:putative nuclease HARBI1 [Anopheles gambiae]|uniref:putative nuclease HARBI1 n=1 Tax=Anopheles coluzzii TaxID=1518534 RepID=UPI0020FF863B|nr:putative nuclease HARBI1 [Anopheles coluzzii]XP_061516009.1 putative nuclease HARBI1 [Anopheles gambiae]
MDSLLMNKSWLSAVEKVLEASEAREAGRRPANRRCYWVQPLFMERRQIGNDVLKHVSAERTGAMLLKFLRMNRQDFDFLVGLVRPMIERMDTNMREAITTQERVLIALRYMATGETFTGLQYMFRVSRPCIAQIVMEVCKCIREALRDYVKTPCSRHEWLDISEQFERRWNFPHAIGAIDGKHVRIRKPNHGGSEYFNYKGFNSIVLMDVVDANYNFLCADAGGKGGISDGGIFKNTRLYQKFENKQLNIPEPKPLRVPYAIDVPYFILGDQAFAFTDYCIRPFPGTHASGSIERVFNYRHSRGRTVAENALGHISNRFWIYQTPIQLQPEKATEVVLTTIYLHNFLCKRSSRTLYAPATAFDRVVDGRLVAGDWRSNDTLAPLEYFSSRPSNTLRDIRIHMAKDFVNNNRLR